MTYAYAWVPFKPKCDKPNQSIIAKCQIISIFQLLSCIRITHNYFVNSSFELNGNGDRDGFPDPKGCNYGIITHKNDMTQRKICVLFPV